MQLVDCAWIEKWPWPETESILKFIVWRDTPRILEKSMVQPRIVETVRCKFVCNQHIRTRSKHRYAVIVIIPPIVIIASSKTLPTYSTFLFYAFSYQPVGLAEQKGCCWDSYICKSHFLWESGRVWESRDFLCRPVPRDCLWTVSQLSERAEQSLQYISSFKSLQ